MSPKPTLGYWDIRGLAQQIRLLLKYLNVDYEDKQIGFGPAPDFSRDLWLNEKDSLGLDFPNVPYYIDGQVRLTESKAILKYVAKTRGPALVPATAELQAKADILEGVAGDLQRALLNLAYAPAGTPLPVLETELAPKFQQLDSYFSKNKYAAGDKLSYVDFYVYEVFVQFLKYNGDFLKPYPAVVKYVRDFEALPQLAEYVKSTTHLTAYSPHATLIF